MGRDAVSSATETSTRGIGKTVMQLMLPTTQLPAPLISPFARASPPALQGSKMAMAPSGTLTERCTQACTRTATAMVRAHSSSRTAPNTMGNIAWIACVFPQPPSPASQQRASHFSSRHGWGTLKHSNGNVYTGEFFNGMQHGRGTLVYTDGRREDGEFKNDVFVVPAFPHAEK